MMAKLDARLSRCEVEYVPHRTAERLFKDHPTQFDRNIPFFGTLTFTVSYEEGPGVREKALAYLDDLEVSRSSTPLMSVRLARNVRDWLCVVAVLRPAIRVVE